MSSKALTTATAFAVAWLGMQVLVSGFAPAGAATPGAPAAPMPPANGQPAAVPRPIAAHSQYGNALVFAAGNADAVTLQDRSGGKARLLGRYVAEIQIRIAQAADTKAASILSLHGNSTSLEIFPGDGGSGLDIIASGGTVTAGKGVADLGRVAVLLLRREPAQGVAAPSEHWAVFIDGQRAGALPDGAGVPLDGELLDLTIGTPPDADYPDEVFHGAVDMAAVRTAGGLLYAHTMPTGAGLVLRALPQAGSYVGVDENVTGNKANIKGILDSNHGIYQKTPYYALTCCTPEGRAGSAGVALVTDWGATYLLAPDLSNPARYNAARAEYAWAGTLDFEYDQSQTLHRTRFTANGSHASGAYPFLRNNQSYELVPPRPAPRDSITPSVFDAGTGVPNFWFAAQGCYNVVTLDVNNFQKSGCGINNIFAFPEANETTNRGVLHNIPYGWTYLPYATTKSRINDTFVSTAAELNRAYSGDSTQGFTALIYSTEANQSVENEAGTLHKEGRAMKIEQTIKTMMTMVLKPDEVRLDQCLILNVLRTALWMVAGGRPLSALGPDEFPQPPPYFDLGSAISTCPGGGLDDALTVPGLIGLYGTHFANATTYGARSIIKTKVSSEGLMTAVANRLKDSSKSGLELDLKEVGLIGKVGADSGTGTGSNTGSKQESESKTIEVVADCIGGDGGCVNNDPNIGNNPVPVYLDLRRFDYLLAPPFFTDKHIVEELRPYVGAEIQSQLAKAKAAAALQTVPSIIRIIDVQLASETCDYIKEGQDAAGQLLPGYDYLKYVCLQLPRNAVLGAFGQNPSGGYDPLQVTRAGGSPESVFAGGQSVLPFPTLAGMDLSCSDPPSAAACVKPTLRLLLEPYFGDPTAKQTAKSVSLKLLPFTGRGYDVTRSGTCTDDCAIRFKPEADIEAGGVLRTINWNTAATDYTVMPHPVTFSVTDPVLPSRVSGLAATHTRGRDGKVWLGYNLAFDLKEEDLAGVLGFKASVDASNAVPPPSLAAVAPAGALPDALNAPSCPPASAASPAVLIVCNSGDYVANYTMHYTQGGTTPAAKTVASGPLVYGEYFQFAVPAGAAAVSIDATPINAVRPIAAFGSSYLSMLNDCMVIAGTRGSPQLRACTN